MTDPQRASSSPNGPTGLRSRVTYVAAVLVAAAFVVGHFSVGTVMGSPQTITLGPGEAITVYAATPAPSETAQPSISYAPSVSPQFFAHCTLDQVRELVVATGLPAGTYVAWWEVRHAESEQPYYSASANSARARFDGTASFVADLSWMGAWEIYVGPVAYDETTAVAECWADVA